MKVVFIGQPNTGKSAIFNGLTGAENIVSNYAGTSMEISKVVVNWKATRLIFMILRGYIHFTLRTRLQDR